MIGDAVSRLYREESGRILATLIRLLGDFDLAEEVVQEAFAAALEQWPDEGLPRNPRAWDHAEIAEGLALIERALRRGPAGPYALQATIAAVHARAARAADTDWQQIRALYALLLARFPSPVVELNHAVAVAMSDGPEAGLRLLDSLSARGELSGYHLLPAARADLLRRLDRPSEAAVAYRAALALVTNPAERRFLERRLEIVSARR